MSKSLQTLLLGTSVLAGVVSLSTPSWGASLSSVSTSGEITVFGENAQHETYVLNPYTQQDLINALGGTATAAGGNIELNNTIDNGWSNTHLSTLKANFSDQRSIVFSSLTQNDWFNNGLATSWYNTALNTFSTQFTNLASTLTNLAAQQVYATVYAQTPGNTSIKTLAANAARSQYLANNTLNATNTTQMVAALETLKVFQRLSDPNVSYVREDAGEFTFGLAGHSTVATGLQIQTSSPLYNIFNSMYASEAIKYSLDNGNSWKYVYSFSQPVKSGVVGSDHVSHAGTFEFTVGTRAVPEASNALAVGVLGGLLALKQGHRMLKKA